MGVCGQFRQAVTEHRTLRKDRPVPDGVTARVGQVPYDVGVTGRRADRVKRIVALLMLNNFSVVNLLGAHRRHRVSPSPLQSALTFSGAGCHTVCCEGRTPGLKTYASVLGRR